MTASSMVYSNGSWIRADALYAKYASGRTLFSDGESTVYAVGGKEVTVSLDVTRMSLERRPITHVWKIRNDDSLLKIVPVAGREITVTPEHKFVVIRNGTVQEVRSAELKITDRLVAPRKVVPDYEYSEEDLPEVFDGIGREKTSSVIEGGDGNKLLEHIFLDDGCQGMLFRLSDDMLLQLTLQILDRKDTAIAESWYSAALCSISLALLRFGIRVRLDPESADFEREVTLIRRFASEGHCDDAPLTEGSVPIDFRGGKERSAVIYSTLTEELVSVGIARIEHCFEEFVYDFTVEGTHNLLVEGLIVHNTTLSDNLIAGAGMMSEELAGKQLLLDYDEQEQARGITINAANASMVHEIDGQYYLINLIDTPGHVDFGGDVTRAMRAIDGVIILVDAVEQVMPQTETVIRQALKERVRPILFINKVDRLINELKVTPEDMQKRFINIINDVNKRIYAAAPEGLKKTWGVRVEDDTVIFGSAYNNWAISASYMKKTKITFGDIYSYLTSGDQKTLAQKIPLHKVVLESVVRNHPNPIDAQKMRIPAIWKGDLDSETGKALITADPEGPTIFMATKIIIDQHAGEVAVGRLFSGTLKRGQELYISGMPQPNRVQTVALSVGADRIPVEEIRAGNIAAVTGL
ncbi:MAG: GTP-binding protein, partial [Thermoplasmata archaeon]|nr:GTP-binding protein [Candidatus Sysuiplasma superficiale]